MTIYVHTLRITASFTVLGCPEVFEEEADFQTGVSYKGIGNRLNPIQALQVYVLLKYLRLYEVHFIFNAS